ncbi:uncharacterized protein LOC117339389 [Pecten maximus]|uniref:uncharacterized protein LOC117339389 n=1 Tax=Pecten maximus TaxID=6579 RepID=UPI0014582E3B|nr:uncharacterized protein LOC117339389 [Pecten maximus]
MMRAVLVFSLLFDVCNHVQGWVVQPSAFTVFRNKHTWNEARQICEHNNNTLLTIPDSNYWTFWKFVLNPENGALHRDIDNSRYWFGLHAPDPNNMTSLRWADCVDPSWIEWKSGGRNYVPDNPCLAFDVFFKPFSTILLKIWLADSCSTENFFVCSEPLTVRNDTCIAHGCDEHVRVVRDTSECTGMCTDNYPECRTNFTNISGLGICHVFLHVAIQPNTAFYRICFLSGHDVINTCPDNNGFGDTGNIINVDPDPTDICLTQQKPSISTDTASTTEISTTAVLPTTGVSQTTTPQMCVCACNTDNQPELTIEEKVEKLKKDLTVNKKNTSLHKRKFISASDDRMSATGIGSFGVGMLVIVLLSIFIMDIGTLKSDLHNMYHNVRSCFCRDKEASHVRHVRHVDPTVSEVKMFTASTCPVVVSSAASPVAEKRKKGDLTLARNDMSMLSIPIDNECSLSPSCSGSVSSVISRSSSNRTGTDRGSDISPSYHSSLSKQSSNTSGNVSRNTSRKSSARSSGMSSVGDSNRPCGRDVQLCRLSNGDREEVMHPNRIMSTDLRSSNTTHKNNRKEPLWLRMV